MSNQEPNLVFNLPDEHPLPGTSFIATSIPETIELPARYLLGFQATFKAAKEAQFQAYHDMVQQFFDDCFDCWACEACNDIHGYNEEPSALLWYTIHEEMCFADENEVDNNMLDEWVARAARIEKLYFEEVEGTECLLVKEKKVRSRPKIWDKMGRSRGPQARGGYGGQNRGGPRGGGRGSTFQRGHDNFVRGGRGFNARCQVHRNPSNAFGQLAAIDQSVDENQQTQTWVQDHALGSEKAGAGEQATWQ